MTDTLVYEKKSNLTRLAMLEDGVLQEVEYVDEAKASEGSIYLGKITHKLELAHEKTGFFVDITDGKDAFLMAEEHGMGESNLQEGQSLLVQVSQERRAEKGAKLVRSIQLVGENIVYCPYRMDVGASSRIENKEKLDEYRRKVFENTTGQEGWILRTSSVDVPFEVIAEEMATLRNTFESVMKKARAVSAPALLYAKGSPLYDAIGRYAKSLKRIVVNNHNIEEELKTKYGDAYEIEYQTEPFAEAGLEDEIYEALNKVIYLPDGGRVIIEEARACTAIDVDSGDDHGNGGISRLNNEAAVEIAKQIRLRNLSGKIIIDFAGSSDYRFMKPVLEILEQELRKDPTKSSVLGLSRAGNVEIIRVRRRPSLSDILTEECECCQGTGRVCK
ncbi:MAG: ribonuclease E/G [Alphaproteobacteria bacterium]|nr:ribonuclease E/G [Alphaproteobacteria bacterium]